PVTCRSSNTSRRPGSAAADGSPGCWSLQFPAEIPPPHARCPPNAVDALIVHDEKGARPRVAGVVDPLVLPQQPVLVPLQVNEELPVGGVDEHVHPAADDLDFRPLAVVRQRTTPPVEPLALERAFLPRGRFLDPLPRARI